MDRSDFRIAIIVMFVVVLVFGGVGGACYGFPHYNVYSSRLAGEALLAKSEAEKRVRVETAQARLDAASLLAQAEVAEARGAAEANSLLTEGLGGPDNYIRWRYILMLEEAHANGLESSVIYVPTEGQIPVMEAGRHP